MYSSRILVTITRTIESAINVAGFPPFFKPFYYTESVTTVNGLPIQFCSYNLPLLLKILKLNSCA